MRYIFLDTETTGLSASIDDRIVEIGCIEMLNRNVTDSTFHVYLNPERKVPQEAFNVHGLSDDFLADKPKFIDISKQFVEFIQGASLIIHNASFDIGFLDMELARSGLMPIKTYVYDVIDSLKYARKLYPGKKNSLDALCDRLEVNRSNREHHGALLDCQLLSNVWLAMTRGQNELIQKNDNNSNFNNSVNTNLLNSINEANLNNQYLDKLSDPQIVIKANNFDLIEHKQILLKIKSIEW